MKTAKTTYLPPKWTGPAEQVEVSLEKSDRSTVQRTTVDSGPSTVRVPSKLLGDLPNASTQTADGGVRLHDLLARNPSIPGAAPDGTRAFLRALQDTDVFAFDIDNTLVDTRERHIEALQVLLGYPNSLAPGDKEAIERATLADVRYSPIATAKAIGLSDQATRTYVEVWRAVFWDVDVACRIDRAMEEVVRLATIAHNHGKRVVCLSARAREHWGDAAWEHLVDRAMPFLRPEDVLLKDAGSETMAFKVHELEKLAQAGASVLLVTDSPEEVAATEGADAGPKGRIRAMQAEFPYVAADAPIEPDTPLIPFDQSFDKATITPLDVGIIVGGDGKSAQIREVGSRGVANETAIGWAKNFGQAITGMVRNAVVLEHPRQLPLAAPALSANRHARIAVGGFFRPPEGSNHHGVVAKFLEALTDELGHDNVAFLTSATTASGTLERVVTEVSATQNVPTVYFTATQYLGLADAQKLPPELRAHYEASTKVVLPQTDLYGWSEMAASTALVNTGGQLAAVSDFVKAIRLGNPVVFLINRDLGPLEFDAATGKPSNGAAYVTKMLEARERIVADGLAAGRSSDEIAAAVRDPSNYPYPFMPHRNFDGEFLHRYGRDVAQLVRSFEVDGDSEIHPVAEKAASHLRRRLGISR